jgi:hypothetical protein
MMVSHSQTDSKVSMPTFGGVDLVGVIDRKANDVTTGYIKSQSQDNQVHFRHQEGIQRIGFGYIYPKPTKLFAIHPLQEKISHRPDHKIHMNQVKPTRIPSIMQSGEPKNADNSRLFIPLPNPGFRCIQFRRERKEKRKQCKGEGSQWQWRRGFLGKAIIHIPS